METVTHLIAQHGYGGLFVLLMLGIVGVPVPDEVILAFSGYMIYKGEFHFPATVLVAFAGTTCGITLSYALGRTLGYAILSRYGKYVHFTPHRLDLARHWFQRFGRWILLFGYFVPGFRHLASYMAGMTKLRLWEFGLFAYTGGLTWSISFILIGYYLGDEWSHMSYRIRHYLLMGTMIVAVLLAAFLAGRYIIRKLKTN